MGQSGLNLMTMATRILQSASCMGISEQDVAVVWYPYLCQQGLAAYLVREKSEQDVQL